METPQPVTEVPEPVTFRVGEFFHGKGLKVVVGFGNWGRENWKHYDRPLRRRT